MTQIINAPIAIIIAALSFSVCPLLYALNGYEIESFTQAFYVQFCVTLVAGSVIVYKTKTLNSLFHPVSDLFKTPWETWIVVILSGIGAYMGTLFFLWAMMLMSKAGAAIIMESWPIIAVIMAPALIKNHQKGITVFHIFLIVLIALGMIMISASDSGLSFNQFINDPLFMFEGKSLSEFEGMIYAFISAFCYAWAGIARPYFVSLLPSQYKQKHFKSHGEWFQALYVFWLTCLFAIPLAGLSLFIFKQSVIISIENLGICLLLGICLTIMGCMYAYALALAKSSLINLLWYISPVAAAIWLAAFGFSEFTTLLLTGGALIIFANMMLVFSDRNIMP